MAELTKNGIVNQKWREAAFWFEQWLITDL
jgi:hypothetical protein